MIPSFEVTVLRMVPEFIENIAVNLPEFLMVIGACVVVTIVCILPFIIYFSFLYSIYCLYEKLTERF